MTRLHMGTSRGAHRGAHRVRRAALGLVAFVLACCFGSANASAQGDPIGRVTAQDISEALMALNNMTSAPGVEGAQLKIDPNEFGDTIQYKRASFQIPIMIATKIDWLEVLVDVGVGATDMDDRYSGVTSGGDAVDVRSQRSVTSGRLGVGPSFIPIEGLNLSPYFAASFGGISSTSSIQPPGVDLPNLTPEEEALLKDWSALSWSVAGVFDAKYRRWLRDGRHRLDVQARYAFVYSETFNASLPILETSGHTHVLNGEVVFRTITDWRLFNQKISWNVFTSASGFPGQDVDDLGFTYTLGFGAGVGFYFPDKIFGIFDRQFVGVRGSGLVGNNTHGWSVVANLRR